MIKLIIASFLCLLALKSFAGKDKSSGCGMGWQVTKSMTTSGSFTRSLTNATFSNTLGMTSGTSGCDFHSVVIKEKSRIHFMESNLVPLKYEVAVGRGERLDAMSTLFGCHQAELGHFRSVMKQNSIELFKTGLTAEKAILQMGDIISHDSVLSAGCLI